MKACRNCGSTDGICEWDVIDADPPCLDMKPFHDEPDFFVSGWLWILGGIALVLTVLIILQ